MGDLTKTRMEYLSNSLRQSPLTIIAQDKNLNGKVIGVSTAGIARKCNKDGSKNEYYDMDIPNDDYIRKLSYDYKNELHNSLGNSSLYVLEKTSTSMYWRLLG